MQDMQLRAEQRQEFREQGFLVLPGLFDEGELRKMRTAFERLEETARSLGESTMYRGAQFILDRRDESTVIQRIVWCGAVEPVLVRYGQDPRLLSPVSQLLGSEKMDHLINQAHFKMPGDNTAFPWHQDSSHRRCGTQWIDVSGSGSYVQTAIALDDHTEENGPLLFIPGSSRSGHLGLERPEIRLEDHFDPGTAVTATMRAGSVLLFGPYVVHGSRPNRSLVPRRTLINGFAYPGANARHYPGSGLGVPLVAAS
jgi:ectoine hydroxylase-related dioxygenase (phytanoyl-CoA dioxygenase family)